MLAVLTVLFIVFGFPSFAFAVDYSIEEMLIEVQLEENSDAKVIETQTYTFDSDFNGITRTLYVKEGSSIQDFRAEENGSTLEVEREDATFKIHRKGNVSETVTIENHYRIENAVELYDDAGQFYWSFFDEDNPSDYENLEIVIHPPAADADAAAVGYGEAEEKEEVFPDGTVSFMFGYVSSGSSADVRAAFDKSMFTNVEKREDGTVKQEIIAANKEREEQQRAFEERKSMLENIASYALGGLFIVLVALAIFVWQRKQATILEMERKFTEPFFVPEEMMSLPATISYTKGHPMVNSDVLTVALLDLVRQGFIRQEDEKTFEVINENAEHEHERHLIRWLFYKVGNDGIFTIEDLKEYSKEEELAEKYQQDYSLWRSLVKEEVKDHDLKENVIKFKLGLGFLGIVNLWFVILFIAHDLILYMWPAILLTIAFGSFAIFYKQRTPKGEKIKRDWKEFIQKYVQFEEKDWEDLATDEQRRAYLYSAGIVNYQINKKNKEFINQTADDLPYGDPNPIYFLLFASVFSTDFNSAHKSSVAASASSSSSSTFTGGGGVGGSGGGSGAF